MQWFWLGVVSQQPVQPMSALDWWVTGGVLAFTVGACAALIVWLSR